MKKNFKGRTRARKFAYMMMYQYFMADYTPEEITKNFWASVKESDEEVISFANELFSGAALSVSANDDIICKYIRSDWTYERMGDVEKSILRVAVYELFRLEAPYYAVINDFVTLAKKYSEEKSAALVNGILENIRKNYNLSEGKVES
ncbi:MAG: transcription antitermination factor NusB [Denitrovibrio sp.]|nr:MAG: transcription antitermination factor NusB [Denitrovibrio sp.]